MRTALAAAVLVLLLTVAGGAAAEPGKTWVLVVGIDRYETSEITPLRYAGADARAVARAFVESAGVPAGNVVLMTSDGKDRERPTSTNILRWLAGFKSVVRPQDAFIFYFSGHGVSNDGRSYLLTMDSSPASATLLRKSSLGVDEVHDALREIRAGRVLQIIDACRNDPRAGGRGDGDNPLSNGFSRDLALVSRDRGAAGGSVDVAATLFACRIGQRSYEGYEGHGYFTYFLVKGLAGEAGTGDGLVTLNSLVDYLGRTVPDAVRLREPGRVQEPWADISGTGASRWVLAKGPATAAAPTAPTAPGGEPPVDGVPAVASAPPPAPVDTRTMLSTDLSTAVPFYQGRLNRRADAEKDEYLDRWGRDDANWSKPTDWNSR